MNRLQGLSHQAFEEICDDPSLHNEIAEIKDDIGENPRIKEIHNVNVKKA